MRNNSWAFMVGVGVWTAITLSGSIFLLFKAVTVTNESRHFRDDALMMFILFLAYLVAFTLIGGGLWGVGIAWLTRNDIKALSRTGALIWSGTATIAGFILILSQEPIMALARATPFDLHTLFTFEFVLAVGLVTSLSARSLMAQLDLNESRLHEAKQIGLAAALGFLLMNLVLWFGCGWEVGRPVPGRYSMVTITNLSNLAAALAGGIALGWTLLQGQRE